MLLSAVLLALALGGYVWVSQLNQKLGKQVAQLTAQAQAQGRDVQVLRERLHISAAELARLSATANDVRHKVSQTQAQLASTQQQMVQAQQQQASELASVRQATGSQIGSLNGQLTGVATNVKVNTKQITQTQAALEKTNARLKTAIGDLGVQGGLIATTQGQLQVLEKLGQRRYFQFQLANSKLPVHVGPIALRLRHIDFKHQRYTVDVYADDKRVQKKNKDLNEPVQFFVGSNHELDELVVYQIAKKQISGYLSTPKYPGLAPAVVPPGKTN